MTARPLMSCPESYHPTSSPRIASLLPIGPSHPDILLLAVAAWVCSDRVTEGWRVLAHREPAAVPVTQSAAILLRFDV